MKDDFSLYKNSICNRGRQLYNESGEFMSRKVQMASELGLKIRNLRRAKKITLIELSRLTGIAQATLSRMETGLMLGTVKSHQKIAETLGISLAELYQEMDTRYEKIHHQLAAAERKISSKSDQFKCELLTQEISKKKITPLLLTLEARGKTEVEKAERGVEKFYMVLDGSVNLYLDQKEYLLNANETLYFDGSIPHYLSNPGNKPARIFCAVSPSKI